MLGLAAPYHVPGASAQCRGTDCRRGDLTVARDPAGGLRQLLGYGIQPPLPSWGNMLNGAQQYLASAPARYRPRYRHYHCGH